MISADSQVSSERASGSTIPVVDLSSYLDDGVVEQRVAVARQLVGACRHVGWVYIINHGVGSGLVDEAFGWAKKLFDLEHEDKMKAPHPDGPAVHRGYSYPGLEKVSQALADDAAQNGDEAVHKQLRQISDYKESYEIGSEDNADQPNVWLPDETLPGFRTFMTSFYWECHKVAQRILRAMAVGIGLSDEEYLVNFHTGLNNQLRLLHYPSIPAKELESGMTARMPAHSDWSALTMLFQDDTGGLEVENPLKAGEFMAATPLKNALVLNVGDLLMRWSNDHLKSTLHRVTLPPLKQEDASSTLSSGDGRLVCERYSIPYFVAPDPDLVVECLSTCVDAQHPAKYEPITHRNYARMRAAYHYETKAAESASTADNDG